MSQNEDKWLLTSPIFVPFGANLAKSECKSVWVGVGRIIAGFNWECQWIQCLAGDTVIRFDACCAWLCFIFCLLIESLTSIARLRPDISIDGGNKSRTNLCGWGVVMRVESRTLDKSPANNHPWIINKWFIDTPTVFFLFNISTIVYWRAARNSEGRTSYVIFRAIRI